MSKKHIALIVVMVLLSIVLVIGGTYAFFIANVSGNDTAENITIASGNFELTFVDNPGIYFEEGIRPGTSASKTFTVENTGTADDKYTYNYNIKLTELDVTYEKQDLVYTLQEYTDNNYNVLKPEGVNETGYINKNTVNEDGEMYLAIGIERPPKGTLHYYKLTIEFKKLDNVNQNYNQGKTFGGKINVDDNRDAALYVPSSLLEICNNNDPLNECLAKGEELKNIYADDPANNLRYAGPSAEVNNYIWFNCNDYEEITKDNAIEKGCEKWRIIGLFKNITKTEGGQEDLVKIIRDSVGTLAWASGKSNNWTNASLKPLLEGYYTGSSLRSAKGITEQTKPMIEQVTWNLGGYNTYNAPAQTFYNAERGTTVPSGAPQTYDGYIGLMYPSDYGYATTGSNDGSKDRATCLTTNLYSYDGGCRNKDWLFIGTIQWTFTPVSSSSYDVLHVHTGGSVASGYASNTRVVRPSLYLKSDVEVVNGKGTSDEPYILQQGE